MGASERTKGAAGEREVRTALVDQLGEKIVSKRRLSQYQESGGHDLTVGPYALEVKRRKRITRGMIERWWDEAIAQAGNREPALAMRADQDEWRFITASGQPITRVSYSWTREESLLAFCDRVRGYL